MRATTKIIALASGAALALAPAASAQKGNHASVYAAKLAGLSGKAFLVDGSQSNALLVHVRDAQPSTAYTVVLSTAPCGQAAATDPAFGSVAATSDADGNLTAKATSASFDAADGTTYSVVVSDGTTAVACGQLEPVRERHRGHKRHKHHGRHHGRHDVRGHSAQSGDPGSQGCDHKS
jgi:hypothetical protein